MKTVYSALADNKEKINLTENVLFDRIINLKIKACPASDSGIKANDGTEIVDEFIIRSDYEIVFPNYKFASNKTSNQYLIQKCNIKPSIKVQFNRVSTNTNLSVDIFINNFVVTTKDGRSLMNFNQKTYNISEVEIQMGYLGQFKTALGIREDGDVSKLKPSDLFNFNPTAEIDTLTLTSGIVVKTEKLPPDYTLHIRGYVGTTNEKQEILQLPSNYEEIIKQNYLKVSDKVSDIFFNNITRRFLNRAYASKVNKEIFFDKNNFLSEADAKKYGVQVFLTNKAKKLELPKIKDSSGNEVSAEVYILPSGDNNTVNSAMQKIFANLNLTKLSYARLVSGDFIVYDIDELGNAKDIENLNNELKEAIETTSVTKKGGVIPAVYNINLDGLATIVCPFFSYLNPFQELEFASRYALSSSTAFYIGLAPDVTKFFVINCSISFATVEDVNEMQITAVIKQGDKNE